MRKKPSSISCMARSNAGTTVTRRFFEHYRRMSPASLSIEYVGRALPTDPWQILEGMWENQQPRFRIEVKETIINGEEAACHHRNALRDGSGGIETIELYRFQDGRLWVRYFIKT